ncbi:MAG: glucosamine-6-phosphate deaminase [Anaerolineae bacterium]
MTEGALKQAFRVDGVSVEVYADKGSLGAAAAARVADTLREAIGARGSANVIFATGASQYEFLAHLITIDDVDWSAVTAFHLDEYLGLSDQHPASFRRYLRERLFSRLPFRAVHVLGGDAPDAQAEVRRYTALLAERHIDIACIGIGENGHLAFNDPPADFRAPNLVNIVTLDEACRRQQVGEGHFATLEDVPKQALSLSIPAILSADMISCVVPDARKAQAVRCTLEGPITPDCPGSALRTHKRVTLYLDADAASLLSRA